MFCVPFSQRHSLAFQYRLQRRPFCLCVLIYFVSTNTLFSETRTHSPSHPYFQAMWASNFNPPLLRPAAVTRNAFVGHWVAGEGFDWLSPITPSYTLCAMKSGRVVCWDVQMDTCLIELDPLELDGSCGVAVSVVVVVVVVVHCPRFFWGFRRRRRGSWWLRGWRWKMWMLMRPLSGGVRWVVFSLSVVVCSFTIWCVGWGSTTLYSIYSWRSDWPNDVKLRVNADVFAFQGFGQVRDISRASSGRLYVDFEKASVAEIRDSMSCFSNFSFFWFCVSSFGFFFLWFWVRNLGCTWFLMVDGRQRFYYHISGIFFISFFHFPPLFYFIASWSLWSLLICHKHKQCANDWSNSPRSAGYKRRYTSKVQEACRLIGAVKSRLCRSSAC